MLLAVWVTPFESVVGKKRMMSVSVVLCLVTVTVLLAGLEYGAIIVEVVVPVCRLPLLSVTGKYERYSVSVVPSLVTVTVVGLGNENGSVTV